MLLLLASTACATALTVFSESRSQSSNSGNQIWHGNPTVCTGGGGKVATVFSWLLELFLSIRLLYLLTHKPCSNTDL